MKRITLLTLSLFAFLAISVAPLVGCARFQNTAGKILVTTADTVDKAMTGWATYVVLNNVPEANQTAVRDAYGKYQIAMEAARQAYVGAVTSKDQSTWSQASAALTAAAGNLTALVATFEGKVK